HVPTVPRPLRPGAARAAERRSTRSELPVLARRPRPDERRRLAKSRTAEGRAPCPSGALGASRWAEQRTIVELPRQVDPSSASSLAEYGGSEGARRPLELLFNGHARPFRARSR